MIKFYDYSPWLTVTVYSQYMTIEALEHEDNVYTAGQKHYWLGEQQRKILKNIKALFDNKLIPVQYGKITVLTAPYNKSSIPWPVAKEKNHE